MKKLATYKNGNTITTIYDDGTKTHFTKDDEFDFAFPECHDISISRCCDNVCEFCYYGCTPNGKHGKLSGWKFFETMRPYTEVAINLQRPMPDDILLFLKEMHNRKILVNVTVNQNHFMDGNIKEFLGEAIADNLIKGIGISLTDPTQKGFIDDVKKYPNTVIHIIAGVTPWEDIQYLMGHGLKLLILGYKTTGRGSNYYLDNFQSVIDNIKWLSSALDEIVDGFEVVSFDNLALDQLNIKSKISKEEWDMMYAGDDGTNTFAIDLVDGTFARNSVSRIKYTIGDKTIDEMFEIIKNEVKSS